MPTPIIVFIVAHWYLAAFTQTVFLHRYGSHQMFQMSAFWERAFYVLTFLTQGASYLNPRAYALMHRMHHAYSDTLKDPHSPKFYKSPIAMMKTTLDVYLGLYFKKIQVDASLEGGYPEWKWFDSWADSLWLRVAWSFAYLAFYMSFASAWWQYLFVPLHIVMGPVHGAIVNWCGHKYGYTNFDNQDQSKNTFFADILTMGELMQNNHHKDTHKVNFASRWFEWDPTYPLLQALAALKIIHWSDKRAESVQ